MHDAKRRVHSFGDVWCLQPTSAAAGSGFVSFGAASTPASTPAFSGAASTPAFGGSGLFGAASSAASTGAVIPGNA